MKKRQYTAKMTPWDRRAESPDQKERRHKAQLEEELKEMEEKRKEKENGIEQYITSGRSTQKPMWLSDTYYIDSCIIPESK